MHSALLNSTLYFSFSILPFTELKTFSSAIIILTFPQEVMFWLSSLPGSAGYRLLHPRLVIYDLCGFSRPLRRPAFRFLLCCKAAVLILRGLVTPNKRLLDSTQYKLVPKKCITVFFGPRGLANMKALRALRFVASLPTFPPTYSDGGNSGRPSSQQHTYMCTSCLYK